MITQESLKPWIRPILTSSSHPVSRARNLEPTATRERTPQASFQPTTSRGHQVPVTHPGIVSHPSSQQTSRQSAAPDSRRTTPTPKPEVVATPSPPLREQQQVIMELHREMAHRSHRDMVHQGRAPGCLACGSYSHEASDCPRTRCGICASPYHATGDCPMNHRSPPSGPRRSATQPPPTYRDTMLSSLGLLAQDSSDEADQPGASAPRTQPQNTPAYPDVSGIPPSRGTDQGEWIPFSSTMDQTSRPGVLRSNSQNTSMMGRSSSASPIRSNTSPSRSTRAPAPSFQTGGQGRLTGSPMRSAPRQQSGEGRMAPHQVTFAGVEVSGRQVHNQGNQTERRAPGSSSSDPGPYRQWDFGRTPMGVSSFNTPARAPYSCPAGDANHGNQQAQRRRPTNLFPDLGAAQGDGRPQHQANQPPNGPQPANPMPNPGLMAPAGLPAGQAPPRGRAAGVNPVVGGPVGYADPNAELRVLMGDFVVTQREPNAAMNHSLRQQAECVSYFRTA